MEERPTSEQVSNGHSLQLAISPSLARLAHNRWGVKRLAARNKEERA